MIQKERIVSTRSIQDVEKLINKLTSGRTFIVSNWKEKRDININTASLDDVANLLATLVDDLKQKGIIQG